MPRRSVPPREAPAGAPPPPERKRRSASVAATSGGTRARRAAATEAPPAARRKSTRLEARITDAQKALLQEAAEVRGQTLTEFVVRASEEAATRVLERAGVVVLSGRDSAAFIEALLHPAAPNERLRAAAARYRAHQQARQQTRQQTQERPRGRRGAE
jgi:uncharacterized protein (DUF1778 family)